MRAGLVDVLKTARSKEVRLGVLSDYPAQYKLERLCIEAFFDAVVDARDQAIGQLKPHPAGLTEVLRLLKVNPNEAVYIGDRVDVDVTAARRVGMRCLIIGSSEDPPEGSTWATVGNYLEVKHCL
jgi:HAD superfamily hydrolase (TIGR01549 family)